MNHFHDGIASVGCGAAYAIAALATLLDISDKKDPEKAILKSLGIAGRFSNGVLEPYSVVCSGKESPS